MNILNKLTIKHLKMNKKRTVVTIIGVLLSTALMVGIGLLFSTVRDFTIKEIIHNQGSHHIELIDTSYGNKYILDNNIGIKNIGYEKGVGYTEFKETNNVYKPYLYIDSGNKDFLRTLTLKKGRLPQNSNEVVISEHILNERLFEIGDVLQLELGYRQYSNEKVNNNQPYIMPKKDNYGEKLILTQSKSYKIVGIVERSFYESYSSPGYYIYTKIDDVKNNDLITAYITYKSTLNIYDKTDALIDSLNDNKETTVEYNSALLTAYGVSKYDNISDGFVGIILIILGLLSVGCMVVIYNSFAISVMERKKQFGLFSSIGATKKQLRKTVFYESLIIGAIGIPLGLLAGFVGIWVVLEIVNNLLSEAFTRPLSLAVYPLFILIPILFMIFVLIFSAFLPARKASKITPIEAIRLNDDIKIKRKKLKTNRFASKLLGVESQIAFKNMKRNKGKYRITIISLVMSIVLFISFSSLLVYATKGSDQYLNNVDFDIMINLNDDDSSLVFNIINDIINTNEVDKYIYFKAYDFITRSFTIDDYHSDYNPILKNQFKYIDGKISKELTIWDYAKRVMLISLDKSNYNKYLEALDLKEPRPIIINKFNSIIYTKQGERKSYQGKLLKDRKKWDFSVCDTANIDINDSINVNKEKLKCDIHINNMYVTTKLPFGFNFITGSSMPIIIVSDEMMKSIIKENDVLFYDRGYITLIKADEYKNLDKKINKYINESKLNNISYTNVEEQMKMTRNIILVIKILFYGFISLVTLIGITSVFNTINTSIALRRREFAMLRSIGLTPKSFNRILHFETLIVGMKSLLYGVPLSLAVVLLIDFSIGEIVNFSNVIIPWKAILFVVIGVFGIVSITMRYATKIIKKDNILDAIREENI